MSETAGTPAGAPAGAPATSPRMTPQAFVAKIRGPQQPPDVLGAPSGVPGPHSTDDSTPAPSPVAPVAPTVVDGPMLEPPAPVADPPPAPAAPTVPVAPPEPQIDQQASPGLRKAFDDQRSYWQRQLAEREAEIKRLKETPQSAAIPADVQQRIEQFDTVKQRAEQAEAQLARINLEYDPQFRAAFSIPMQEKLESAKQTLAAYDIPPENADVLRSLKGKDRLVKIRELTKDLGDMAAMAAAELTLPFRAIDEIQSKREAALKNAKSMEEQLETQRTHQIVEFRTRTKRQALDLLAANGDVMYKPLPNDYKGPPEMVQKWNQQVTALHQHLDGLLSGNDVLKQTLVMAEGLKMPIVMQYVTGLRAQLQKAQQTIQNMTAAAPGGQVPAPEGTPAESVPAGGKKAPLTGMALARSIVSSRSAAGQES